MPLRVTVLAFDGCFATELFGISDLLGIANDVLGATGARPAFRLSVASVEGRPVTLAGGTVIKPEVATLETDLVVVPGFTFDRPESAPDRLDEWGREIDYLRRFSRRKTGLGSLCIGGFLLAEAGLLNGRTVTTSWLFAGELARRYPLVDVQASSVVVRDGRVRTCGAFTAYQDLALELIAEHAGEAVARTTSSLTLLETTRQSQSPYVTEGLIPVQHDGLVEDAQQWLRTHLHDRYDLSALAAALHVSTRTLLRRFAAETGASPLDYLHAARVRAAQRLLETSDLSVGAITQQIGYGDAATFRAIFRGRTGVTPSEYRRRFAVTR